MKVWINNKAKYKWSRFVYGEKVNLSKKKIARIIKGHINAALRSPGGLKRNEHKESYPIEIYYNVLAECRMKGLDWEVVDIYHSVDDVRVRDHAVDRYNEYLEEHKGHRDIAHIVYKHMRAAKQNTSGLEWNDNRDAYYVSIHQQEDEVKLVAVVGISQRGDYKVITFFELGEDGVREEVS